MAVNLIFFITLQMKIINHLKRVSKKRGGSIFGLRFVLNTNQSMVAGYKGTAS